MPWGFASFPFLVSGGLPDSCLHPRPPWRNAFCLAMTRFVLVLMLLATTVVASPSYASEQLAKAKACLACHQVGRKVVGPAYQDISSKYAGRDDAQAVLVQKILKGSSGEWGVIPMPANRTVKPEEAEQLAQWILGLKKP